MVLKAVIEEGEDDIPHKMQNLSLSEGAFPRHLHVSLFTKSIDNRLLTHRQLSRHLISLLSASNQSALLLLSRIFVSHYIWMIVNDTISFRNISI